MENAQSLRKEGREMGPQLYTLSSCAFTFVWFLFVLFLVLFLVFLVMLDFSRFLVPERLLVGFLFPFFHFSLLGFDHICYRVSDTLLPYPEPVPSPQKMDSTIKSQER